MLLYFYIYISALVAQVQCVQNLVDNYRILWRCLPNFTILVTALFRGVPCPILFSWRAISLPVGYRILPSFFDVITDAFTPIQRCDFQSCALKVFTNEKRGGLIVISFDRPPFKLLSRKFSKESVHAPSCERHKPTQRTLFLLFANNYWFPITLLCLAALHFWHSKLNWNIGIVHPPRYLRWREKSGIHNKSFQIMLTIRAMFGDSAKVLHRYW